MKQSIHRILMLVGLIAGLAASVSAYEPMLVEGRVWQYRYGHDDTNRIRRAVDGDTIVGETKYKKLIDPDSGEVKAYMREEGLKVFRLRFDADGKTDFSTETLLYDFSVPEDSTFTIQAVCALDGEFADYEVKVEDADRWTGSCNLFSMVRQQIVTKRLGTEDNYSSRSTTFSQCIGCMEFGTLEAPYLGPDPQFSYEFPWLYVVIEKDGSCLYYSWSGVDEVNNDRIADGRMYDLMGREIREPQRGTVYIQNGRKKVQR